MRRASSHAGDQPESSALAMGRDMPQQHTATTSFNYHALSIDRRRSDASICGEIARAVNTPWADATLQLYEVFPAEQSCWWEMYAHQPQDVAAKASVLQLTALLEVCV
jgi:hypothetical protein